MKIFNNPLKLLAVVIIAALMAVSFQPLMTLLFTGLFITMPFSLATVFLAAVEIVGVWALMALISPNKKEAATQP